MEPKVSRSVLARPTGLEPAAYRVGGVVGSRMARISKGIVLVIDKFGEGKKGFEKVFRNFSKVDLEGSRKK